jgi:hypothetical protein
MINAALATAAELVPQADGENMDAKLAQVNILIKKKCVTLQVSHIVR